MKTLINISKIRNNLDKNKSVRAEIKKIRSYYQPSSLHVEELEKSYHLFLKEKNEFVREKYKNEFLFRIEAIQMCSKIYTNTTEEAAREYFQAVKKATDVCELPCLAVTNTISIRFHYFRKIDRIKVVLSVVGVTKEFEDLRDISNEKQLVEVFKSFEYLKEEPVYYFTKNMLEEQLKKRYTGVKINDKGEFSEVEINGKMVVIFDNIHDLFNAADPFFDLVYVPGYNNEKTFKFFKLK